MPICIRSSRNTKSSSICAPASCILRARELHAEGKIQDLYVAEPFERRLIHLHRQCEEIYPDLDIMHLRGRAMFEFMRNDSLLDLVEPLIGTPEITCNPIQHLRPKLPASDPHGGEHVAKWHQDIAVMLPEADPVFILTVWIALAEASPENGCMKIIPGVRPGTAAQVQRHPVPRGDAEGRACGSTNEQGGCPADAQGDPAPILPQPI